MRLKPVKIIIFISAISLLYGLKVFLTPYLDPFGATQWNQFKCKKNHEAQIFKEKLEIQHILRRSQNCSNYFETLAALIYRLPPDQLIDVTNYKNSKQQNYVKPNSMAVSYVIHNNPGLFEILFHVMFRPYNNYCIIIDPKSSKMLKLTLKSIIKCYQETFPKTNIIIANWTMPIYYFTTTGYSSLNADLTCLELLYHSSSNWKYHINVAGTELPMYNLDDFSAMLNKKNIPYSVGSEYVPQFMRERWTYKYVEETGSNSWDYLQPVPFNLTIFKGQRGVILSRNFTKFILEDSVSKSFRKWIKDTAVPEESYLQTLVRITKINKKGSKIIKVEQNLDKSFDTTYDACLRFAKWSSYYWSNYQKCHGVYIRLVCHLALEDYNEILEHFAITRNDPNKNACFMLNKFNLEVDLRPVLYLARLHSPILKGF